MYLNQVHLMHPVDSAKQESGSDEEVVHLHHLYLVALSVIDWLIDA